jgi:hypothetical protein
LTPGAKVMRPGTAVTGENPSAVITFVN